MQSDAATVLGTWLVGSDASCDIVVADRGVSARHCRLTRFAHGFTLEDLGSTNGTYIDESRLPPRQPTPVRLQQRVTLGLEVAMPWPGHDAASRPGVSSRAIRIGRSPDSDIVLDYPVISWEHARVVEERGQFVLEDLSSSNGTAVNGVQNRVTRAVLSPEDDVYLGSLKVPASLLLGGRRIVVGQAAFEPVAFQREALVIGRDPQCDHPVSHAMVSWRHARLLRTPSGVVVEDLGSLNGTFVDGTRVTGRVRIAPGQEIALGSVRFQLLADGTLERRENQGNVAIQAVEVTVNAPDGTRLLDPVSLTVYPSELVALMGPAGAGKTTFLKALNGYTPPAGGAVLFNGADLYRYYDLFRQQMGYVPQDDIVHSELTVREALYFSARLRTDLSEPEIEARIDEILDALGILDKKHSLIGSPERKVLSGGQRKRVNIALELISDTPVLFLDEPTSGLSSYDAAGVIDLLDRLSAMGKTIIATIHQPSLEVFRKFDNLIMISRDAGRSGALVYFGPAYPDSIQFFREPPGTLAPDAGGAADEDLAPEMLLTGLAHADTAAWTERFSRSHYRTQFVDGRAAQTPAEDGTAAGPRRRRVDVRQWLTLMRRSAILKVRDRAQLVILLLQAPLFAALIVLVFGRLEDPPPVGAERATTSPEALQAFTELSANLAGIEFLMVVAAIWFGCNNAARDIVGEWTIFQRERMVNLTLPSYVLSKFTIMVGLCVLQCLALVTIVYVLCDLKGSFVLHAATLVLASLVGAALGLAISARSGTTESAIALLPVVLLPVITLGGGIRAIYKIPEPAHTLSYVVPSRWALEINLVDEARARPCGYLPATAWDDCPAGGPGVDAATAQFPEAVTEVAGIRQPAPPVAGETLRHTTAWSLAALAAMLALLLAAVAAFLRMRDVH